MPSEDEDGTTDYTDLGNDGEESSSDTDNSEDSSDMNDSQETDDQSNNNKLKNYSLLKDFESLYRLANEIGDTIEPLIMEKPIQNKVLTKVRENLIMIKQSIKNFITMNFSSSYPFNLYCYELYADALRTNIEILEKNKEFSEKIKEQNKKGG